MTGYLWVELRIGTVRSASDRNSTHQFPVMTEKKPFVTQNLRRFRICGQIRAGHSQSRVTIRNGYFGSSPSSRQPGPNRRNIRAQRKILVRKRKVALNTPVYQKRGPMVNFILGREGWSREIQTVRDDQVVSTF